MSRKWIKGRIDTSTGRNKRDKCTVNERKGLRPGRQIGTGKIISRAEFRRQQKTARRRGR